MIRGGTGPVEMVVCPEVGVGACRARGAVRPDRAQRQPLTRLPRSATVIIRPNSQLSTLRQRRAAVAGPARHERPHGVQLFRDRLSGTEAGTRVPSQDDLSRGEFVFGSHGSDRRAEFAGPAVAVQTSGQPAGVVSFTAAAACVHVAIDGSRRPRGRRDCRRIGEQCDRGRNGEPGRRCAGFA